MRKLIAGDERCDSSVLSARRPDGLCASHAYGFRLEAAGKAALSALAPIDADAGSAVLPLSYLPGNAIPADVLLDGRILFESGFPLGSGSTPELFLVYSDGSGVESYRCDHGRARWGGKQLASGDVVFTHGASLARFTSPLAQSSGRCAARRVCGRDC